MHGLGLEPSICSFIRGAALGLSYRARKTSAHHGNDGGGRSGGHNTTLRLVDEGIPNFLFGVPCVEDRFAVVVTLGRVHG